MIQPPQRERGVALITVMLVVAMATAAAASMTADNQFDMHRSGHQLARSQAHQVALGGEAWAMGVLARDRRGDDPKEQLAALFDGAGDDGRDPAIDARDEVWAQDLPPIPIEGGQVTGRIIDAQGRININSLAGDNGADPVTLQRMRALLRALELDPAIARAIADWVDADGKRRYPGGAEDDFYVTRERPYRSANRPVRAASELRLVRGIDAAAWDRLAPYVTALPGRTAINVNTASAPVLQAIAPGLERSAAKRLVEQIRAEPFTSVEAFAGHPAVREHEVATDGLSVGSSHFRVRVDARVGDIEYTLYSWLRRSESGASRTLRRSRQPN